MKQTKQIIYKGGPCNMALCPKCRGVDFELVFIDDYFKCLNCGLTGDINKFQVIDVDWDTPKGYKATSARPMTYMNIQEVEN